MLRSMTIPPELSTPLIGLAVAAIPTAILWLRMRGLIIAGQIRDLQLAKTAKKVDELHEMATAAQPIGASPSSMATTIPPNQKP